MPGRRCWYRASRSTQDKWAAERRAKLLEMAALADLVCARPCLLSNCAGDAAYKATMFHSFNRLNRLGFKLAQEPAAESQVAELRFMPFPVGRGPQHD
jgi:hypothetical protein